MYTSLTNSEKKGNFAKNRQTSLDLISSLSYITIPTHIFRSHESLAVLESLVLFLKAEKGLSYHDIGVLLGRDERNIWTVYSRVQKKISSETESPKTSELEILASLSHVVIPTHVFRRSESLAVLESIVLHLKDERGLTYHEIGVLLARDERNIWTVYSRAKKKLVEENEAQVH